MFLGLITRPITRIFDLWQPSQVEEAAVQPQQSPLETRDQIEEATPQLQHTSLDNQDLNLLSDMPPNDQGNASGDDWKTVRNGRHEGRPRPIPGIGTHKHRTEHLLGREDPSQSRLRAQSARLKRVENDHRQLANEHGSLQHSHRQLFETHQTAITNLHETQMTCKGQQQEIHVLREKLRDTSALLDTRNQELKVAKTFLSKEDPFSTSEVVQVVRDLNSEIMQTAAHLAETLPLKRFRTPSAEEVPEGPYKSIFVALVLPQGSGEDVDVVFLELALQGFLALSASGVANAWGFSNGSGWCSKVYSKVCEAEDHTVASNWRVLTRRALGHMDSSDDNLPRKIVNGMVKQLADLLSSCGVGNPAGNANDIRKCGAEKLEVLFTAAQKLNRMIGENVISEDLTVSVIRGGTIFDGERMDDTYARAGVEPVQRAVICTTDLGLCERKQTRGARKVLLKPKVFL